MRPAHMALHLAALSGRATEQPDISAAVGVCRYCLLHYRSADIAAQLPYLRAVQFAVNMFTNTNGK
jgi:hypothetical protein